MSLNVDTHPYRLPQPVPISRSLVCTENIRHDVLSHDKAPITVLIHPARKKARRISGLTSRRVNKHNLISLPKQPDNALAGNLTESTTVPSDSITSCILNSAKRMEICLINARSIANKAHALNDLFTSKSLDFFVCDRDVATEYGVYSPQ